MTLQALHDQGRAAFREGRFQVAADRFERAYARDPHPILLWNIGRAYEEAERWAPSREAFGRYRALTNLSLSQRMEVALKLLDLERRLVAEEARRREAGRTTGQLLGAAILRLEVEPVPPTTSTPVEGLRLVPVDALEPPPPSPSVAAPWIVGVGVALVLAGGASLGAATLQAGGLDDLHAYEGLSRARARGRYEGAVERVQALELAGWVALGLGVAASMAGVLTWWLGESGVSDGTPSVSFTPTEGGGVMRVEAGF